MHACRGTITSHKQCNGDPISVMLFDGGGESSGDFSTCSCMRSVKSVVGRCA